MNNRTRNYHGYFIVGNEEYAFAVSLTNKKDIHHFHRDPDVNNDAFIRACGWAYDPSDENEKVRIVELKLRVSFAYEDKDETPPLYLCKYQLEQLVSHAAGNGMLTGETDMVVDNYHYSVDEDEIVKRS